MTPRITSAAIRVKGRVYRLVAPARHSDIWLYAASKGETDKAVAAGEQGFMVTYGDMEADRFVSREEAYTIAKAAGQIIKRDDIAETVGTLYTEDLW